MTDEVAEPGDVTAVGTPPHCVYFYACPAERGAKRALTVTLVETLEKTDAVVFVGDEGTYLRGERKISPR